MSNVSLKIYFRDKDDTFFLNNKIIVQICEQEYSKRFWNADDTDQAD